MPSSCIERNTYAQRWHKARGGKRRTPQHDLARAGLPKGLKPAKFGELCRKGLRVIKNSHARDAQFKKKYCGSKQSRSDLWACICRCARKQAGVSRVAMVPCIYVGHALAAKDNQCSRKTIARGLKDLERWGLIVVEPGLHLDETRIGIRLMVDLFPDLARPTLRAQYNMWAPPVAQGAHPYRPWRRLIADMATRGPTGDPRAPAKGNVRHKTAEAAMGMGPRQASLPLVRLPQSTLMRGYGQNVHTKDLASKVKISLVTPVLPLAPRNVDAEAFSAMGAAQYEKRKREEQERETRRRLRGAASGFSAPVASEGCPLDGDLGPSL